MKTEEFLRNESDRGTSYKILSACYYLPEIETLANLAELEAALSRLCPQAAESVAMMRQENDIEQLQIDYSRLFVGPFKLLAPPYGSVYLEDKREVMGASTLDARKRYKEAGLDISDNVKEAPDHIAVELEFLFYLIFKEIEAVEKTDLRDAMAHLERQRAFLMRHLGMWVSEFAETVDINAKTEFYSNLARATKTFVQRDMASVSESSKDRLGRMMRE